MDKNKVKKVIAYGVGVIGSIGSFCMLRNISPYTNAFGEVACFVAAEFLSIKAGHLVADQFIETWDEIDDALHGNGPTMIIV